MRSFHFSGIVLCLFPALLVVQASSENSSPVAWAFSPNLSADCNAMQGLAQVVCLAEEFKAKLIPEQLASLQLPYSKTDALKWSNFPQMATRPKRVGLSFGVLTVAQMAAAKQLMAAVLETGVPNEGLDEFEGNLAADDYFGAQTGKTDNFGTQNYFIAFLGTPSTTGLWELQFGGHHYAFANTYNKGKIVGVTPSFRGVEPMTAFKSKGKTYQPVEQEKLAFAALLGNLSVEEQSAAKLSSSFSDVLLGPGRDGQFPTAKQGIRVSQLSEAKQKLVLNAIKLYVNDLDAATANVVMAGYTAELAETFLAYSGSATMGETNDYIRIDGPGIWIEYSAQPSRDFPGTIHPHSVWRDHKSDYGAN